MSELIKFVKTIDFTDYTLVIPSVSVGNVPQLTVDVIISTYDLQRTGIIWHPAIVPSVGGDPFTKDSTNLTTACELYANEDLKLAVIQMRSSIEPKYATTFFQALLSAIKTLKFKQLVILTSAFAHEMHDIKSSLFRCLQTSEIVQKQVLTDNNLIDGKESDLQAGTGFALKFYNLAKESSIDTFLLGKYTSEGDNRPDSIQMLQVLFNLFENFKGTDKSKEFTLENIRFPSSWDHVFGNPPPLGIY